MKYNNWTKLDQFKKIILKQNIFLFGFLSSWAIIFYFHLFIIDGPNLKK
jgi:hypothetical protein